MTPRAIDTETFLIERPVAAPRMVCTSWSDASGTFLADRETAIQKWHKWASGADLMIGHSFAFDTCVAMACDPDLVPLVFRAYADGRVQDTLLNFKLIDIAYGDLKWRKQRGYDLGTCAARAKIDVEKSDPWRLRYADLAGIPIDMWPEDAVHYAKHDAFATLKVWQHQQQLDAAWRAEFGSPILHQAPARARYDFALRLAGIWGVRCDPERVSELKAATERRMFEIWKEGWTSVKGKEHAPLTDTSVTYTESKKMKRKAGDVIVTKEVASPLVRVNGSKNMAAAQKLVQLTFEGLGLPVPMTEPKPNPKTGKTAAPQISTSRDTCILSGSDVLEDFADYARTGTLIKRIEDLGKGVELPLQPRYDSLLESGRTSSSKGIAKKPMPRDLVGVQIQNFPRSPDDELKRVLLEQCGRVSDARSCVVPREGNVFILADYSSGELHTLAQCHRHWFGRSTLGDMLNAGIDVHMWFGALAYGQGVTYEEAKRRLDAGDKIVKGWRQAAKPIVFGRPGGMGAKKMVITARKSYGVRFTLDEAKRLIALYDNAVPELKRQFELVKGLLGDGETCLIKQLFSDRWRGGCSYSAANNSFFQGLLAEGCLDAMFEVQLECYSVTASDLYGSRVIAEVHDEIVAESKIAKASKAAKRLSHIMEKCLNVYTPDYPTPAEPVVTSIWSKDAKGILGPDGELVAWEPRRIAA